LEDKDLPPDRSAGLNVRREAERGSLTLFLAGALGNNESSPRSRQSLREGSSENIVENILREKNRKSGKDGFRKSRRRRRRIGQTLFVVAQVQKAAKIWLRRQ